MIDVVSDNSGITTVKNLFNRIHENMEQCSKYRTSSKQTPIIIPETNQLRDFVVFYDK